MHQEIRKSCILNLLMDGNRTTESVSIDSAVPGIAALDSNVFGLILCPGIVVSFLDLQPVEKHLIPHLHLSNSGNGPVESKQMMQIL